MTSVNIRHTPVFFGLFLLWSMFTIKISKWNGNLIHTNYAAVSSTLCLTSEDSNSRLRSALSGTAHIHNQRQTSGLKARKAVLQINENDINHKRSVKQGLKLGFVKVWMEICHMRTHTPQTAKKQSSSPQTPPPTPPLQVLARGRTTVGCSCGRD